MAVYLKSDTFQAARSSPTRLHWVPCRIEHNGRANVSKYFETCVKDGGANGLTSSLRGRPLSGQKVELPPGYVALLGPQVQSLAPQKKRPSVHIPSGMRNEHKTRGLVVREGRRPVMEDEDRSLSATHSFTEFHDWNLDKPPSTEDSSARVLQFINIAKAIHRPVDEESSQMSVTGK